MKKLLIYFAAVVLLGLGATAVTVDGPTDPGNCPPGTVCTPGL